MGLSLWKIAVLLLQLFAVNAFQSLVQPSPRHRSIIDEHTTIMSHLYYMDDNDRGGSNNKAAAAAPVVDFAASATTRTNSRRLMLFQSTTTTVALLFGLNPKMAMAAAAGEQAAAQQQRKPLGDLLYTILRVREATLQESRLIKSGKFKDVQRANIKLAVKFMVQNYRLADTFIAACTYLKDGGTERRMEAGQVGQTVVQNLITITEYFDSSDVQNLKVGSKDTSMSGKEELVLKGLDAARKSIDEFLAYFPAAEVDAARTRVKEENALNVKEFDPSVGSILNLDPNLL